MRVLIKPTELARETFPDEKFESVELAGIKIPIGSPTELTDTQHASLFAASFAHPENGLPCKYFIMEIVTTPDPASVELANAVVTEVKLYAAIYANLLNTLGQSIDPSDAVHASTAIYTRIKDNDASINSENPA